jgi:hypothetical protein
LIEFHFNIATLEWFDKPKIPDVEEIPKLGYHLKKGFGILEGTLSNMVEEEERQRRGPPKLQSRDRA